MKSDTQKHTAAGIWSPILTALDDNLELDTNRTVAHVKWSLEQGLDGVVLFGTTGEANSFSVAERMQLLDAVLAAGIDPERLMIGNGCCALPDTVQLTRHALENKCKKVLMLPPFYYKNPSDAALARSYGEVIERAANSDLEVYLYNFPRLSTVPITQGLLELLIRDFPKTIRGVKDSSGDWDNTRMMLDNFPGLAIFPGTEIYLLDALKLGGAGTITATANAAPGQLGRVYTLWKQNDRDVEQAQAEATRIRKVAQQYPFSAGLKFLLSHYHNDPAWLNIRPPLMMIEKSAQKEFLKQLNEIDFSM